MRKAWGSALDQQLVSTAKRLSIGPYELIAEAVRDYLERNGEERDPAQRVPSHTGPARTPEGGPVMRHTRGRAGSNRVRRSMRRIESARPLQRLPQVRAVRRSR